MTVQVELSEIERLKSEIERLTKSRDELTTKLKMVDEESIQYRTTELTKKMFNDLCAHVFSKLGFQENGLSRDTYNFHRYFIWANGEPILNKEVEAEMGAYITANFQEAFVKLGIKRDF